MKNIINICLLVVICYILYKIYKVKNESFSKLNGNLINKVKNIKKNIEETEIKIETENSDKEIISQSTNNTKSESTKTLKTLKTLKINNYFSDTQFHNDYRDTITAFDNLYPSRKINFNKQDIPVKTANINQLEVKKFIKKFINNINDNIINEMCNHRNKNSGWNEIIPEKKLNNGYEKSQENLNLPKNLYNDPAERSEIKLIFIKNVEKQTTSKETRYIVYMIVQKNNVSDQMVMKLTYYTKNTDINYIVEDIFVMGYLIDDNTVDDKNNFEIKTKNNIVDQEHILRQLIQKKIAKQKNFNSVEGVKNI